MNYSTGYNLNELDGTNEESEMITNNDDLGLTLEEVLDMIDFS